MFLETSNKSVPLNEGKKHNIKLSLSIRRSTNYDHKSQGFPKRRLISLLKNSLVKKYEVNNLKI